MVVNLAIGHRRGRHLDGRDHRAGIRDILACDIECGAMIRRSPDDGKTQSHIDAVKKMQGFERDQGLIMIRTQGDVIFRRAAGR